MHWILIPFRGPETGKSRLRGVLNDFEREGLAMAMFRHVLATAVAVAGTTRVAVVSPSGKAAEIARLAGVSVMADERGSLNEALSAACRQLVAYEVDAVTILAADLPLLSTNDVAAMLAAGPARIAIATDRHGTGTNALTVPTSVGFRFAFGAASRAAHEQEAARLDLSIDRVMRDGLAYDVDEAADLMLLPDGFLPDAATRRQDAA